MAKLTIEDLKAIREKTLQSRTLREGKGRARIVVHMGTCGIAAGARTVMSALLAQLETRGLSDVIITTSGCAGLCSREPMVTVEVLDQPPVKYADVDAKKITEILEVHVLGGRIVEAYALGFGSERTP
jgi:NADP-reducing hydrogenase subunit HndB